MESVAWRAWPVTGLSQAGMSSLRAEGLRGPNPSPRRTGVSLIHGQRSRRFRAAEARGEGGADKNRGGEADGEKRTVDWDKAWSRYSKPQRKKAFLKLNMEQYVSRSPKHSDFPLSEEVDPLRRSERSILRSWTSIKFTYGLIAVIVGLAVYMVIIVGPPPPHGG